MEGKRVIEALKRFPQMRLCNPPEPNRGLKTAHQHSTDPKYHLLAEYLNTFHAGKWVHVHHFDNRNSASSASRRCREYGLETAVRGTALWARTRSYT